MPDADDDSSIEPEDAHPHNPAAVRGPSGLWNEHSLPVLLWEVPDQRKVVPVSVQELIRHASPVLRVSIDVDVKQRAKHPDVLPRYEMFDLESWSYVRRVEESQGRRWEFIQIVDEAGTEPWPLMTVIGEDERGSLNLISLHRRNRRWLVKVVEGRLGFETRKK